MELDWIAAARNHRLLMYRREETVHLGWLRNVGQPSIACWCKSVHRKVRNDTNTAQCGPLDRSIDIALESFRNVNRNVADAGLQIHVQIRIKVFRDHPDKDFSQARGSFHPSAGGIQPDVSGFGLPLKGTSNLRVCNIAARGLR